MLFTSGFVPEAHEFSGAGSHGRSRSELSPVNPEWPIATMPIGVRSPESGLIELPSVEGELLVPPQPPTTIAHRQATINGLTPSGPQLKLFYGWLWSGFGRRSWSRRRVGSGR